MSDYWRRNALFVVGLAVMIGGALWVLRDTGAPAQPRAASAYEQELAVRAACQTAVKDRLVSPGSMKVGAFSTPTLEPDGRWKHVLEVDSQNAFGALLRSTWSCTVADGRVTGLTQLE